MKKKLQFLPLIKNKNYNLTFLHDPRIEHHDLINNIKIMIHNKEIKCPICDLLKNRIKRKK